MSEADLTIESVLLFLLLSLLHSFIISWKQIRDFPHYIDWLNTLSILSSELDDAFYNSYAYS